MIVFALIFWWSIHLCNTFKKKKIVDGHDGQYTCVIIILLKKKIVARESTVRWLSLLWYFDDQYTCVIDLKKKKIGNGHDGQYTCVIFILLKKKIFARESTVWWLSLLWYFDGQYTCVIDLKKKNCRWSWWSIHLRNNYFIKKKNCRKKKHCSLIVFALIFRWSIHVCNRFKKKKNCRWSWWSIHLRNNYFI